MGWMKWNVFNRISPLGMVVVGATLSAATFPVVKKTARSAVVLAVSGVMGAVDTLKGVGESITHEWNTLVSDARARRAGELPSVSDCLHSAGVSVLQKGFEIGEMTKNKMHGLGAGLKDHKVQYDNPDGETPAQGFAEQYNGTILDKNNDYNKE